MKARKPQHRAMHSKPTSLLSYLQVLSMQLTFIYVQFLSHLQVVFLSTFVVPHKVVELNNFFFLSFWVN